MTVMFWPGRDLHGDLAGHRPLHLHESPRLEHAVRRLRQVAAVHRRRHGADGAGGGWQLDAGRRVAHLHRQRLGRADDLDGARRSACSSSAASWPTPLNRMNLLTLPGVLLPALRTSARSCWSRVLTIVSFTMLIAGNLSAVAWVLSVVSGSDYLPALVRRDGRHRHLHDCRRPLFGDLDRLLAGLHRARRLCRRGGLAARDPRASTPWSPRFRRRRSICRRSSAARRRACELGRHDCARLRQRDGARLHGARVRRARRPNRAARLLLRRDDDDSSSAPAPPSSPWRASPRCRDVADPRMVLPTMAVQVLPYWIGVHGVHRRARRVDVHGQRRHPRHLGGAGAQRHPALAPDDPRRSGRCSGCLG